MKKICKCLKCGHELTTPTGIRNHIKKKHKVKPPIKKGVHFEWAEPGSVLLIEAAETKKGLQLLSDETLADIVKDDITWGQQQRQEAFNELACRSKLQREMALKEFIENG